MLKSMHLICLQKLNNNSSENITIEIISKQTSYRLESKIKYVYN